MKKTENGRSMIEMLGVLAIIGVLSVGGLAGYTSAMTRHRANTIIDYASRAMVTAQTQNLGTGGSTAAGNCNDFNGGESLPVGVSASNGCVVHPGSAGTYDFVQLTLSTSDIANAVQQRIGGFVSNTTSPYATIDGTAVNFYFP